jgi:hypothetical protein
MEEERKVTLRKNVRTREEEEPGWRKKVGQGGRKEEG